VRRGGLLFAIVLALLAAGCAKQSAGQTTVTLFTWVPPQEYALNQQLIARFEKQNKGIQVRYLNEPGGRAMDKLQAMIGARKPPDVMSIHGAFFVPLAAQGALLDLDPLIRRHREFNLGDFLQSLVGMCRWQGKLYSLPRYTSVYVLFYNKDLFDAAGVAYPSDKWTWDDYLAAAKKLTKRGANPADDQWGCVVDIWSARAFPWIWQNGGDILDRRTMRCVVDSPAAAGAVQFLMDLRYRWKVCPPIGQEDYRETKERFKGGRVAMFMSGAWDIQVLREAKNLRWDVAPLPHGKQRATLLGMENYAIAANTEHPEAAFRLFSFLLNPEAQQFMADKLDKQPSRRSVMEGPYLKAKVRYDRKVMVDAVTYGREAPNVPGWTRVEHYLNEQMDRMWQGETPVREGLRLAAQRITEGLRAER
jgi:multiple sugar transport system substrate-binding protein